MPPETPAERLIREVRGVLSWARIEMPSTLEPDGLLEELAAALDAYDDAVEHDAPAPP